MKPFFILSTLLFLTQWSTTNAKPEYFTRKANVSVELFYNHKKINPTDTIVLIPDQKSIAIKPTRFRNEMKNVFWTIKVLEEGKIRRFISGQGFTVEVSNFSSILRVKNKVVLELLKLEGMPYSPAFIPGEKIFTFYIKR